MCVRGVVAREMLGAWDGDVETGDWALGGCEDGGWEGGGGGGRVGYFGGEEGVVEGEDI